MVHKQCLVDIHDIVQCPIDVLLGSVHCKGYILVILWCVGHSSALGCMVVHQFMLDRLDNIFSNGSACAIFPCKERMSPHLAHSNNRLVDQTMPNEDESKLKHSFCPWSIRYAPGVLGMPLEYWVCPGVSGIYLLWENLSRLESIPPFPS